MNTLKNPPLEKLPNHICATCHLTRAMHQYPYPDRGHLFTTEPQEAKKPMQDEELTPTGRKRQQRRPCAVCGKRTHAGRGLTFDHQYEPMGEKAAAARRATHERAQEARAAKEETLRR